MKAQVRATAVPGGVTHFWRIGSPQGPERMGLILGTFCGLQRPPRILPWQVGAWPRDCKRCVKIKAANPNGDPISHPCLRCGSPTKNPKFCSVHCSALTNRWTTGRHSKPELDRKRMPTELEIAWAAGLLGGRRVLF
jgi:hypothetical protein